MTTNNALWNAKNPWQGEYKKVLCVCSAGLLRSPTTALVLSQEPYNFNTRACGIDTDWALIPISPVLANWADEFVVMTDAQADKLHSYLENIDAEYGLDVTSKTIKILGISDDHGYRDDNLIKLIKERYDEASK